MLKNEYLVAKIGVDTAEHEHPEEWCVVAAACRSVKFSNFLQNLNFGKIENSKILKIELAEFVDFEKC